MVEEKAMGSASPSLQGGQGWVTLLKVLIAVLTAIAGSLGVASCVRTAPSTPPEGELAVIAAKINLDQYESVSPFREV